MRKPPLRGDREQGVQFIQFIVSSCARALRARKGIWNHVLALCFLVLWCGSVSAQERCGAGVCGGGLQCLTCPATGPTCARPPATCCGAGVCGDGLQCLTCASGPTCARPPAVCCGSGVCGDGLVCTQTAQGPQCTRPAASPPPARCGTGVCGGGLVCMTCPGSAPTCARPPAVCCGSGVCGDGLQCLSCPGTGPTCARPPAVCCGSGICGGGLVCEQTPQGQMCVRPSAAKPPVSQPPLQKQPPQQPPLQQPPQQQPPQTQPPPTQPSGQGQFRSRWDQVGGSWTTGWVPNHPFQGCVHGTSCSCGSENYCGNYRSGQTTTVWPQGCSGPRWTIRCTSELQQGAGPSSPPSKPAVPATPPAKSPSGGPCTPPVCHRAGQTDCINAGQRGTPGWMAACIGNMEQRCNQGEAGGTGQWCVRKGSDPDCRTRATRVCKESARFQ